MTVATIIPVRYESSRFPGKPLALCRGQPLLQWAWRTANESERTDWAGVVTDSLDVTAWCRENGVRCVHMPERHPTGSDRTAALIARAKDEQWPILGKADIVVNLQCDEPDLTGEDLDRLIATIDPERRRVATFSCRLSVEESMNRNAVKVVVNHHDEAIYFSRAPICAAHLHIGVYAYTAFSLEVFARLTPGSLEQNENLEQLRLIENHIPILVLPLSRTVRSINTPDDLEAYNCSAGT